MKSQVRACASAFTFFTRLPLSRVIAHDANDLAGATPYFPVVGIVVGLVGAATYASAQLLWPPSVAVVLSVVATVWMTGAFHEDALADSLDGFGGGWSKEQVLAIMKDSRVGSYALIGVVLVVLAKVSALVAIHDLAAPIQVTQIWVMSSALIVAHTVARCTSVWLMYKMPYVRAEQAGERQSAGRPFVNVVTAGQVVAACVVTVAVAAGALRFQAAPVLAVAAVITAMAGRYFQRRIGGITGDALGAANQLVELGVYLTLAARPLHEVFS